jgi:hypothetical protein
VLPAPVVTGIAGLAFGALVGGFVGRFVGSVGLESLGIGGNRPEQII